MKKIKVGILGATGVVGQTYLFLLRNHPYFHVTVIASSSKWAGKSYGEAIQRRKAYTFTTEEEGYILQDSAEVEKIAKECDCIFSSLPSEVEIEAEYARWGLPVISSSSKFRMESDVPILIPEINAQHLSLISLQQKKRAFQEGFIVSKPNCSLQSYLLPLYPLHQRYQLKKLVVTTFQSVSGAGFSGLSSFEMTDNILPFIEDEEEKNERELHKILGDPSIILSCNCHRVPTTSGHLAAISAEFSLPPSLNEVQKIWNSTHSLELPSAPEKLITYVCDPIGPQLRIHKEIEKGMGAVVGRLRTCPILQIRFVALTHNLIRGAAGGGILIAELLVKKGWIHGQTKQTSGKASRQLLIS